MSAAPGKNVWFGCKKCHSFYPTLERGIQHLIHSPQHTSETIDLIGRYSDTYREAAADILISFTIHSPSEHTEAVAEAQLDALQQAAGRRGRRHIFQHDDLPGGRGRLDHSVLDNSNRSQNVSNRQAVTNNLFMEPINVRVTVCPRPTHPECVFPFAFARTHHTTVRKLLQAVDASYRERNGAAEADLAALSAERLMMKLSKKNGDQIGGAVGGDRDVWDLSRVLGGGWFGEMEIG